ncbi:MAG: MAPEG family protein [Paraglaciecola sp.]|uniref:MAPEG family protein n=1 Tax=Paraglaciecola sp. TaxID=1920173 RepID=UPI00329A3B97
MFFISILTIIVGLIAVRARFISIKSGQMSIEYLKLMQGQEAPEMVIRSTRCFNNLFEVPVLFYVVCTLYIALGIESFVATVIAWLFAAFRLSQAFIHIYYNAVRHRMVAFGLSVLCVLLLWVNLVVVKL